MTKIKTCKGTYIEDITGCKFGRLTVLKLLDEKNNDNRWLWECECSCQDHTIIKASMHHLKSGNTKSCGCLQKEWAIKKNKDNALDITNERKGTLVAIKKVKTCSENNPNSGGNIWEIQCDCGNIFELPIGEWRRTGKRERITCPKCNIKSKGQIKIRNILDNLLIDYIEEWTDNGKCINPETNGFLRFDFYLPDYNCCIEYDGEQHYKSNGGFFTKDFVDKVKERDKIKNNYCLINKIKLIRIPYTKYEKINNEFILEELNNESI